MQQLEVAALAAHDRATVLKVDIADVQRQHLRRARRGLIEQSPQRLLAHRDIAAAPQSLKLRIRGCGRRARVDDRHRPRRRPQASRGAGRTRRTTSWSRRDDSRSPLEEDMVHSAWRSPPSATTVTTQFACVAETRVFPTTGARATISAGRTRRSGIESAVQFAAARAAGQRHVTPLSRRPRAHVARLALRGSLRDERPPGVHGATTTRLSRQWTDQWNTSECPSGEVARLVASRWSIYLSVGAPSTFTD
jgi:hypothetical protein